MPQSMRLLLAFLLAAALATSGCAGSAAVKSGFFYGIDVRKDQRTIFVLDISGSMGASDSSIGEQLAGNAATRAIGIFGGRQAENAAESARQALAKRIEKAKLQLIAAIAGLPPDSTFNVVIFRDHAMRLSPMPLPAHGFSKAAIATFVYYLKEGGSTDMIGGIRNGLEMQPTHLVILGDGEPTTSSTTDILDLLRSANADHHMVVSTVGVGEGHDGRFLEQIAREHNGFYVSY